MLPLLYHENHFLYIAQMPTNKIKHLYPKLSLNNSSYNKNNNNINQTMHPCSTHGDALGRDELTVVPSILTQPLALTIYLALTTSTYHLSCPSHYHLPSILPQPLPLIYLALATTTYHLSCPSYYHLLSNRSNFPLQPLNSLCALVILSVYLFPGLTTQTTIKIINELTTTESFLVEVELDSELGPFSKLAIKYNHRQKCLYLIFPQI